MSWSFGNAPPGGSNSGSDASGGSAQSGPDLPELLTEQLAFDDVSSSKQGDFLKISDPWDPLPPPYASLLSIASRSGILAAASQDGLVIASTERTRKKYLLRREVGQEKNVPIEVLARLPSPRLSHIAFSTDESCLVVAAEEGGGLAVYNTNALATGGSESAFQISTNGAGVRHIIPNPNPELAHYVGVILTNGQLILADLQKRDLVDTAGGNKMFHDGVVSASWSKMGKQIVVGLQDGTCAQIDPQGVVKDHIPKAPQLDAIVADDPDYAKAQAMPVTSILWLQNHTFLIIYTPFYGPQVEDARQDSIPVIAERANKTSPFQFRKFDIDPSPASLNVNPSRCPANYYMQRLSEWEPEIADLVLVSSTASTDVGLVAKFASQSEYVTAAPADDVRRAALPFSITDESDTSPIGMAVDLGAKEVAPKPIPSIADSMENAPFPLPCMCILNTDGLLSMWWVVYADSIKQNKPYSHVVHKTGNFDTYRSLGEAQTAAMRKAEDDVDAILEKKYDLDSASGRAQAAEEREALLKEKAAATKSSKSASNAPAPPSALTSNLFAKPQQPSSGLFGQSSQLGASKSPLSQQSSRPTTPSTTNFGQPSQVGTHSSPFAGASTPKAPAFGQTSQIAGNQSAFGQASRLGTPGPAAFGKSSFGQTSNPGGGFGQVGSLGGQKPAWGGQATSSSPFTKVASQGVTSPFGAFANKGGFDAVAPSSSSPFSGHSSAKSSFQSPFANANQTTQSLFGGGAPTSSTSFSSASFGKQSAPPLSQQTSTGSTATLNSNGTGLFGGSNPTLSTESTGLSGLGGFKLGSTFQGDGTAKDDLPRPDNPGSGLFGKDFGKTLGSTQDHKATTRVSTEPGTENYSPSKEISAPSGDAPLPPDPSAFDYKRALNSMEPPPVAKQEPKQQASNPVMDDPLPPDPSQFDYKKALADLPPVPGVATKKDEDKDKDFPIAGSPPQDITHSQTFSPAASEAGPPEDDHSESWAEEDAEDEDEDEEDEGDDEDDEDEDEDDEDESIDEGPYVVEDPKGLDSFMARVTPKSTATTAPESPGPGSRRGKSTTPKSLDKSYTPAGFPKGPVLHPRSQSKAEESPRSPSPQRQPRLQQRAVTSPMQKSAPRGSMRLPPQITADRVPPARPVERPVASPKPREPTAGELVDEADARVKAILAAPIEPTREPPPFYTHQDYAGSVETPGLGGQIEKVFRDVNSMIDVVGLNARSVQSFIQGQIQLRMAGARSREDLDDPTSWCLGDMDDMDQIMDDIKKQLGRGRLENVQETLQRLSHEQQETIRIRARTTEMRKQINAQTDPARKAEMEAAPLSAETAAQQLELRQGLQRVQKLLNEAEVKMTELRADLASLQNKAGANGSSSSGPMPTVEAVERTILRMTAMIQQKSGDIDLLESRIKHLPNGTASLHLADDYEDDLAARFGGSRFVTDSPSRRTPQKYPRMAANGDALGMSGMFGFASSSRYRTPPSASASMRASVVLRGSMSGSAMRHSTGSWNGGGSARKKMADVTDEEVEIFRARTRRRKDVLGALQRRVEEGGPRIVKVD